MWGLGGCGDGGRVPSRWSERATPTSPADPVVATPVAGDAAAPGGAAADPPAAQPVPHRRHVVIMSIDGCRPDALAAAPAPNLLRFGTEGTIASNAFTIALSLTLPSHSAMLSGYDMEHHGVTWNAPQPELGFIKVPTIFAVAHAAGFRTAMIMGKGKFLTLQLPDTLDEVHEVGYDDDGIAEQALFLVHKGNFDLLFIHMPNPDLTGHAMGWMSPAYLEKLAHNDVLFARITNALPPDATVIVSSDHGGHDYGHGTDTDIDRRIPWMIKGPGIRKGLVVTRTVQTMDTGATALKVLGLDLPAEAQGRPVTEAFAP